jgi:hypothetical protein
MWRRPWRNVGSRSVGFGTVLVLALLMSQNGSTQAPAADAGSGERTVWYFYRVKWGKQDQFLDLFQKNHYPILKAQLGSRLTGVKTYVPTRRITVTDARTGRSRSPSRSRMPPP